MRIAFFLRLYGDKKMGKFLLDSFKGRGEGARMGASYGIIPCCGAIAGTDGFIASEINNFTAYIISAIIMSFSIIINIIVNVGLSITISITLSIHAVIMIYIILIVNFSFPTSLHSSPDEISSMV